MAATSFVETHGLHQLVSIGVLHIRLGKFLKFEVSITFELC